MQNPPYVARVLKQLRSAGFQAYLVGGCVRDFYMDIPPHDFDITTNALPEMVVTLFADSGVVETGLKHGTVTVLTSGGPVEVTTFRQDTTYSDHRHPDDVIFTPSLTEDLARRDFTMNAIALSSDGEPVDPFGGRTDIAAGIIRCVGEADKRFSEDALRILRALRFAARLGFTIEPETAKALLRQRALLLKIAPERILSELSGLLIGKHAAAVLDSYREVFAAVLPELHLDDQTLRTVDQTLPDRTLRFAALFLQTSPGLTRQALLRLRADNALLHGVLLLMQETPNLCPPERAAVHSRLARLGKTAFFQLTALQRAAGYDAHFDTLEQIAHALLDEKVCLSIRDLAVGGQDLMALGLQGPEIGKVLDALFEAVTTEQLPNNKKILLDKARSL